MQIQQWHKYLEMWYVYILVFINKIVLKSSEEIYIWATGEINT